MRIFYYFFAWNKNFSLNFISQTKIEECVKPFSPFQNSPPLLQKLKYNTWISSKPSIRRQIWQGDRGPQHWNVFFQLLFSFLFRSIWVHNSSQNYRIITNTKSDRSSKSELQKSAKLFFTQIYLTKKIHSHKNVFLSFLFIFCFGPNFENIVFLFTYFQWVVCYFLRYVRWYDCVFPNKYLLKAYFLIILCLQKK